jgi:hypothetical protein
MMFSGGPKSFCRLPDDVFPGCYADRHDDMPIKED